jgi:hypothetical protein
MVRKKLISSLLRGSNDKESSIQIIDKQDILRMFNNKEVMRKNKFSIFK